MQTIQQHKPSFLVYYLTRVPVDYWQTNQLSDERWEVTDPVITRQKHTAPGKHEGAKLLGHGKKSRGCPAPARGPFVFPSASREGSATGCFRLAASHGSEQGASGQLHSKDLLQRR